MGTFDRDTHYLLLYLCINKNDKDMTRNYYLRFTDSSDSKKVTHELYRTILHKSLLNGYFDKQVFHRYGATLYLSITNLTFLTII